ncbi:hypothetical protein AAG570_004381 [Ranatra chinensis]|uniref:Uncharacterized protein n=1 Tax=Ranatra chinensis TaxID=642074 RepID=A0ABD0Y0Z1_9HEMI
MGDNPLLCNVGQCRRPIGDRAWVTRCLHVFCSDHGMAHFGSENAAQVACPACNEINVKETDVVHCDLNPHDMILFGLPPQKAIRMAVKSLKLWWYQMEQEREFGAARYEKLNKKISEVKSAYERVLNQLEMKLQSEIDGNNKYRHRHKCIKHMFISIGDFLLSFFGTFSVSPL